MNLRMLGDQIAVKPDSVESVTTGGLIVIDTSDKPRRGVVVASGPGVYADDGSFTKQTIQAGDVVAYAAGTGVEIDFDGTKLLIIKEEHVIGNFVGATFLPSLRVKM